MIYKIGSFNVKNLAWAEGKQNRDLDRLANLIKKSNFDILALQEVLSEGKILNGVKPNNVNGQAKAYEHSLKRRLGSNWEFRWLDPKTNPKMYPYLGKDKRGEGYAFLWNTKRIELPENINTHKPYEPRTLHQYSTKGKDIIKLIRDPAIGYFKIKNRPVEIRLITTHIIFGKPSKLNVGEEFDSGAVAMRKNEFSILANRIYKRVNDESKSTKYDVRYTILLGDYNLNLKGTVPNAVIPSIAIFDNNGRIIDDEQAFPELSMRDNEMEDDKRMFTLQTDLTTLKKNEPGFSNNFDHFTVDYHTRRNIENTYAINGVEIDVDPNDIDDESKFASIRSYPNYIEN